MSEASASCTGEGGGDYGPDYSAAPSQQTISVSLDSFARFEGQMGSSQDQDSSLALVFSPNSQFSSTPLSPSPHVDAGGSSYSTVGGTQQNTEQNSSLCSNSHLVNTTPAAARQEGMDVETLSSTPLPKDTYAAVKKGNKRSHFESEGYMAALPSDADFETSAYTSASQRSASGQNPPRHETAKSRRTEEKPNAYSNQDKPPYAVHIHALVDNGASPPHPMKMFAQVGRVMPAADILEMKKLGNGQVLPSHVNLFWSRHEVRPYVPKARICYSCFRAGHVSASCRSTPRCLYCGKPPHSEGSVCPLKNSMPRCINCTDSRSVLSAIATPNYKQGNHLIHHIKRSLILAETEGKKITLCWVPAHKGIPGNEKADLLAKLAASRGTKTPITAPYTDLQIEANTHRKDSFKHHIEEASLIKGIQYAELYLNESPKPWYKNKRLKREEIVCISRIRSNHYNLNYSLHRKNIVDSPACPCGEARQDINHIIFYCSLCIHKSGKLRTFIKKNFPTFVIDIFPMLKNPSPRFCSIIYAYLKSLQLII